MWWRGSVRWECEVCVSVEMNMSLLTRATAPGSSSSLLHRRAVQNNDQQSFRMKMKTPPPYSGNNGFCMQTVH